MNSNSTITSSVSPVLLKIISQLFRALLSTLFYVNVIDNNCSKLGVGSDVGEF